MNTQELLSTMKIVGSTLFGILAMHGYMTTDQASAIMGDLTVAVPALLSLGTVAWSMYSHWNMKKVPENSIAIEPHVVVGTPTPGATVGLPSTAKVVGALLIAFLLAGLLAPDAHAQVRLKTPQQIAADVKHAIDPSSPPSTPSKPGACDITLFTSLSVTNVVTDIQNCIGSVVAGGAAPFVTDIAAALKSATDAKDGTAIACLTPALEIATAAMGTPASADGSTPAVYPGPILIFQKYREFVTAGGPSNCKTAVQSTINGTVASAL